MQTPTSMKDAARIEKLRKKADSFKRLDREAATHVESVICLRTHFTGEQPYVGWKGLGLALNEALDERDQYRTALRAIIARADNGSLGSSKVQDMKRLAMEALGIDSTP